MEKKTPTTKPATKSATKATTKATAKRAVRKRATTKRAKALKEDLFSAYIENIKKARQASQELVADYVQEEKSSLVINLIWEAIFDYFCRVDKEEISPSNLNTLAGVVQKLLASTKDTALKEKSEGSSISAQALAEIEDKLNLL